MIRRSLPFVFAAALLCACSGSGSGTTSDEPSASSALADKELTLENVYLAHADPRDWEPGDPKFAFPVAAEIFYGYRPMAGYRIDRGDDCATFDVKENVDASKPAAQRAETTTYEVSCTAKSGGAARVVARSDRNWSQEEENSIILGTSLKFEAGVKLTKLGDKHYRLDVGPR